MRLTREFNLFCLALRQPQDAASIAALRRELAEGPDWDCIVEGARRHRVESLLLAGLQACRSPDLPARVVAETHREALAAARRSLGQIREIARLTRLFSQSEIRVMALKGVVLSAQLYGDPALRNPRDIDLLVDPDRFSDAEALLTEAGYRRSGPRLSPRQAVAYRRWIKDAGYIHAATGILVELHHRLSDNPALIACNFSELWEARQEVDIAGAVVATLPRRFVALYLCAHGAAHCWEELRWLADFAAALQEPDIAEAAITAARSAGLEAPMLHALMLAHDWLGAPVGAQHLDQARADRRVRHLHRILSHFYAGALWCRTPPRASLAGFLRYSLWLRCYAYSLKPEWAYWRHQAMREFVTPADWQTLRLPDRLFWVFPLIRPIGWLVRRWRGRRPAGAA